MKVFGDGWANERLERCPTPIGCLCIACEKPIADGDLGVVMPLLSLDSSEGLARYHRECLLSGLGLERKEAPRADADDARADGPHWANEEQQEHMRSLARLSLHDLCWCGWSARGYCYGSRSPECREGKSRADYHAINRHPFQASQERPLQCRVCWNIESNFLHHSIDER